MIVKTYRSRLPNQMIFFASPEEQVGQVLLGLLKNDPWVEEARAIKPPPDLEDTRIVGRSLWQESILEEIRIYCSREVFNKVVDWIEKIKSSGWWGGPILPGL